MGRKRHLKEKRPPPDPELARRNAALLALRSYHTEGPISHRYAPVLSVLADESDRGAIILVAGILDDILGERITSKLANGHLMHDELLRQGGVAGFFADRMTLALAMGIIDKKAHDDIELLRLLRNKCAHTIGKVSLSIPAFNGVLALLVDPLTADDISADDVTDVYLRNILSFVMVYLIERVLGKTEKQAQETIGSLVKDMMADRTSPETPPTQSPPGDLPDQSGKTPSPPPESSPA